MEVENIENNLSNEEEKEEDTELLNENIEIEERALATLEYISDDDTISKNQYSEVDTEEEYSSGTMIEASDSTYDHNDDSLDDIEKNAHVSLINSDDFSFNIANVYDEGDRTSIEESSEPDLELDIPIIELAARHNNSSTDESVQLFNLGTGYEKALKVMFTQMSAQKGIKMFGQKAVAAMFKELK